MRTTIIVLSLFVFIGASTPQLVQRIVGAHDLLLVQFDDTEKESATVCMRIPKDSRIYEEINVRIYSTHGSKFSHNLIMCAEIYRDTESEEDVLIGDASVSGITVEFKA